MPEQGSEAVIKIPRHPKWFILLLAFAAMLAFVGSNFVLHTDSPVQDVLAQTYEIPPTFAGLRWLYGGVLALLLTSSALGFGAIIENLRFLATTNAAPREPARVMVVNETMQIAAFVLLVLGDVLVLMAWGEAAAPANSYLARLDRFLDGGAACAFAAYLWRRLRVRPVLIYQLLREPIPLELEPTWEQLKPKFMVAVGILVVSFGVAFGK